MLRRHRMQNNMIDGSLKNRFDDQMAINGVRTTKPYEDDYRSLTQRFADNNIICN